MSHLGRWLSAQIDGELEGIERDRVLNHLAGCEQCRREASALRALKRRMTELGDSAADAAIAGRLIERAKSEPDLVASTHGKAWALAHAAAWPRQSWPRQVWPGWRIATGSAGTVVVAVGLLAFLLGGSPSAPPSPKVTPAVDSYWMQHSFDTGQKPATGAVLIQSLLPSTSEHSTSEHGTQPPKASRPTRAHVRRHHRAR